jgi:hypothetical protein
MQLELLPEVIMLDTTRRFRTPGQQRTLVTSLALLLATAPFAKAQSLAVIQPETDAIAQQAHLALPDSPGALVSTSIISTDPATSSSNPDAVISDEASVQAATAQAKSQSSAPKRAFHLAMVVHPGEIADPMTTQDKVVGGLKDSISLFSAIGWGLSAGYDQLANSSPNYGTDSTAFGKRFGAAVARDSSETIFSESLFAPLFHEDPRYYVMGPGHSGFKRLVYAGTRCIIGRTDSGHTTPNFALIAGNAAGAGLTVTYYPGINTTGRQVASTFGTSLGGSALAYVVDEFIVDALIDLHIKRREQNP